MFRPLLIATLILTLGAFGLRAEQLKGKIKNVSADKNSLTVTVGKTDQQFVIPADAKVQSAAGKDIAQRLQAKLFQPGVQVQLTTENPSHVRELRAQARAMVPAGGLQASNNRRVYEVEANTNVAR